MANDTLVDKISVLEAAGIYDLIDNKAYVNMFYARLRDFREEVIELARIARKKRTPSRYFATSLSVQCLSKSLNWLREMIERAKSKSREVLAAITQRKQDLVILAERKKNAANVARYDQMVCQVMGKKFLGSPTST